MAHPLRLEFPRTLSHVTSRGHARQRIVKTDADRQAWLSVLGQVIGRFGWLCHTYCLLDSHYHLLIETPQAISPVGSGSSMVAGNGWVRELS